MYTVLISAMSSKHFPDLLSQVTLLPQALSRTLCQTGWWRNHCSLWCLSLKIRPGVAHEPMQKSQKAKVLTNPSPYHSVSIIRNALPKLNHCSIAKKITNINTDTASGHYRLCYMRRNKTEGKQQELVMNERGFSISPDSLIVFNS